MAFIDPASIVARSGVREGMIVADFGCGPGELSFAAARRVGGDGIVYAIDIQKDVLARVSSTARELGLSNVKTLWGDIEEEGGTHLRDASCDLVYLSNVLFLAEDKGTLLNEVVRVLRSGGRLLIVDWTDAHGGLGPAPSAIVPLSVARELCTARGFQFTEEFTPGDHHYGAFFVKSR